MAIFRGEFSHPLVQRSGSGLPFALTARLDPKWGVLLSDDALREIVGTSGLELDEFWAWGVRGYELLSLTGRYPGVGTFVGFGGTEIYSSTSSWASSSSNSDMES